MNHRVGPALMPPARTEVGAEGNARLTASNGVLLIGLLFVEGLTILRIRALITPHIFLGIVLLGPVLLKTASTVYRFACYYTRHQAYVRRGPPHPLLRVIGPLVILSTLTVLGTGLGLLATRPGQAGLLLTAHKASFIVWFGLTALHVLGHLRAAAVASWRDLRPARGDPASRGRAVRAGVIVAALLLGVGAATALMPTATAWTSQQARLDQER